jgi:hypothetical protein
MIDIRIVCAHDGLNFAETLARLLGAEQHNVRLTYGRLSPLEIEASRASREAVLLIWSFDAPGQHYMLEWARGIDPSRLVEVARTPGAPRVERRAPIVDFAQWRGERGCRAWNALNDRLRVVARVVDPPRGPPKQAALALGLASVAAVGGALFVRVSEAPAAAAPAPAQQVEHETVAVAQASIGMGGAIEVVEPPTFEEDIHVRTYGRNLAQAIRGPDLAAAEAAPSFELRDPTFLERLAALNPLRHDG